MKLCVHELQTTLSQVLVPPKNVSVGVVRPHLYLHNQPAGHIKVQIRTSDGEILAESATVNFSDITNALFFHGYVRFDVKAYLKKDVEYLITVVPGGGYSFNESAYCGVCNDFDLRKYEASYPEAEALLAPLDIEVWNLPPR